MHEDVEVEENGGDAVVGDGILEPDDASDAVGLKEGAREMAKRSDFVVIVCAAW